MSKLEIGKYLDEIYERYRHKHSSKDPVWLLHKFQDARDIEIAGLVTSCYSYGRVDQINEFMNKLLSRIGYDLNEFTLNFSEQKDKKHFRDLYYRFNSADDLLTLFLNIKHVQAKFGSLKNLFFSSLKKSDSTVLNAIGKFSEELKHIPGRSGSYSYLVPFAERNSACKRLNLFLRWMVREDEIDLGCWKQAGKQRLIFPVDTHVYRVSAALGLVNRRSCDMKFAIQLTDALREYDSDDPVKYDFALCHIGIDKAERY